MTRTDWVTLILFLGAGVAFILLGIMGETRGWSVWLVTAFIALVLVNCALYPAALRAMMHFPVRPVTVRDREIHDVWSKSDS